MTGFGAGIETARSAIRTAAQGMAVVSQNIAGAQQDGYVRRTVDIRSVGPGSAIGGRSSVGFVDVSVGRSTDVVLDQRVRIELSREAAASTSAQTLSGIESVFDEPSDTGLAAALDGFWNSFADVADGADPSVVLGAAGRVTDWMASASGRLDAMTSDATSRASSLVTDGNATLTALAALNRSIAGGGASLEQLDERDRLTQTLATTLGATSTLAEDGSAVVSIGGAVVLQGSARGDLAFDGTTVTVDGAALTATGGSLGGQLEALGTTLPAYRARLDDVARSLRDTVNDALAGGRTADGAAGGPLFTGDGVADLKVAIADPKQLALAGTAGGSDVAVTLSQAGMSTTGPDARYRTLVADVGAQAGRAVDAAKLATASASSVIDAQRSVSAVSTDEELSSMMSMQRGFEAASRVLTTVDDMLDTLINRTGRVGL